MEFRISDLAVRDWRTPSEAESPADLRPMSDQVWEVLEAFTSSDQIAGLMQGLKLVDAIVTPDATIDAAEWAVAAQAMRRALGGGEPERVAAASGEAIYSAFELVLAQTKRG